MNLNHPRRPCLSHRLWLLLNTRRLICRLQHPSIPFPTPNPSNLQPRYRLCLSALGDHAPSAYLAFAVDPLVLGRQIRNESRSTTRSQILFLYLAIHGTPFSGVVVVPTSANIPDPQETSDHSVPQFSRSARSVQFLFAINARQHANHRIHLAHARFALSTTTAQHAHTNPMSVPSAAWRRKINKRKKKNAGR
jgi:hypothetical protein